MPAQRLRFWDHECEEVELMRKGMDYDRAHNIAKRREDRLRREKT